MRRKEFFYLLFLPSFCADIIKLFLSAVRERERREIKQCAFMSNRENIQHKNEKDRKELYKYTFEEKLLKNHVLFPSRAKSSLVHLFFWSSLFNAMEFNIFLTQSSFFTLPKTINFVTMWNVSPFCAL